jgi:predicted metalloprotease
MRLDNQRESSNVEDARGSGGGFGSPFGGGSSVGGGSGVGGLGGVLIPLLLRTIGFRGIIILAVVYFGLKLFTGIDLLNIVNGGGGGIQMPNTTTQIQTAPSSSAIQKGGTANGQAAAGDSGKQFVAKVLGSTEDVWSKIFADQGMQYVKPKLVLFSNYTQSGCGTAQSSMGPFYCPADQKVYIDLAFYQELKDKLGAPGDFAQAYVVAHEVGHHVQNLLGISDQVETARRSASDADANRLSVKVELQADCLAGVWATEADAMNHILENGDVEEALNAASQIGDDHLQKAARGYAVPDTFTHGTSAQRVKWFKTGLQAKSLDDCDTFKATNL